MRIACWMALVALSLPLGLACSQVAESKAPQLEGRELAAALADEGILLFDVREPSELELPRDKRILTA